MTAFFKAQRLQGIGYGNSERQRLPFRRPLGASTRANRRVSGRIWGIPHFNKQNRAQRQVPAGNPEWRVTGRCSG
ncbi:hypothetical protein EMIT0158MI4_200119 [Burkholderia ambifaria]